MRGMPYAAWELKSAILRGRADTLKSVAADDDVPLDEAERQTLRTLADKLTAEAREIVRRG